MNQLSDTVAGAFNYVAASEARPVYYLYKVDPAEVKPLPAREKREMPVRDARSRRDDFSMDVEGFSFADFAPDFDDWYDEAAVKRDYYPQVEVAMKRQTGASRVVVFDHNVRHDPKAMQGANGAARPVRFVHNDYTERSGPQRVKDILGKAEAAPLLNHRFSVVNLWRPIRGPVEDMPLAVLDARSMTADDFVDTDLMYRDRKGEVSSVRHNAAHRWYYLRHMRSDEALFLKCFDNARDGRARFTAHSAFDDPTTPPDAPARESIETRTLVFFAPSA